MYRKFKELPGSCKAARGWRWGIGVCLLAGSISAWSQTAPISAPVESVSAEKQTTTPQKAVDVPSHSTAQYTVSPEDLLDVYVMDVPEVSRLYRVSSNGFLTLPLLAQPIAVAGLSLEQLSALIATKFREAGMLNNAHVTVELKETRQHQVIVSGAVKRPQGYPIFGPTKLFDLVMQAGGPTEDAGDKAVLTRGEEGTRVDAKESNQEGKVDSSLKEQTYTLDIRKLLQTGDDPTTNILLYPGDRVVVLRASLIYILGAVARPGGYVLTGTQERYTVLKAVARAGGLTGVAKMKQITLLRKDPSAPEGKPEEIIVDFRAMVKGEKSDMTLVADDILYIPESTVAKAMHSAVTSAVTVGTGLAVYRF